MCLHCLRHKFTHCTHYTGTEVTYSIKLSQFFNLIFLHVILLRRSTVICAPKWQRLRWMALVEHYAMEFWHIWIDFCSCFPLNYNTQRLRTSLSPNWSLSFVIHNAICVNAVCIRFKNRQRNLSEKTRMCCCYALFMMMLFYMWRASHHLWLHWLSIDQFIWANMNRKLHMKLKAWSQFFSDNYRWRNWLNGHDCA